MYCGIGKLKLHLQSDLKHIHFPIDVLNEGLYGAIVLNLVKATQTLVFWHITIMLVTFKDIKVPFVNYIINALPIDSLSFINGTNIAADFILNNVTVIK
jgi:hypothetical protein